jgi:3-dehydrosphinganine reductase
LRRVSKCFAGQHALITGGSTGIGFATARRLVELGAGVTLVARREEVLHDAAAELTRLADRQRVRTLALDVTDEAAVGREIPDELGAQSIDLLVNCAGVAHAARFMETDASEFRRQMDVNYFGTLAMARAVIPHFLSRGTGYLVNVGSLASLEGVYGYSAYAPSKFAVHGLSQVLRAELRVHGIGVSVLQPPNTQTAQLEAEEAMAPPETLRISRTTRALSADRVARALVRGVAHGRFEIIPGLDSRLTARLHRMTPTPLRAYFDWQVRRPA